LLSTYKPFNPTVNGDPKQVCEGKAWVDGLVNKISAGSILSIMGPDLKGELTHIFTPNIRRSFEGTPVEIAGNTIDVKGDFSLR
jgi:hypothetical protein